MPKNFKPTTPGQRKLVLPIFVELSPSEKKAPKSLRVAKRRTNGRNHSGHITCRHKGGAHKRAFRLIDFKRDKENIPASVASVEYDPNRSSLIALLHYKDGEKRYILAPQGIKVGSTVMTSDEPPFQVGCCMKLRFMPLGSVIHNIEMRPGKGAQLVRSAGLSAQLLARSNGYATIRMPSGEVRMINENCRATFGAVSNAEHNLRVIGKAGRSRWLGIRPTVRGVAMNPVDHPHGGGRRARKRKPPTKPVGTVYEGIPNPFEQKNQKMDCKRA